MSTTILEPLTVEKLRALTTEDIINMPSNTSPNMSNTVNITGSSSYTAGPAGGASYGGYGAIPNIQTISISGGGTGGVGVGAIGGGGAGSVYTTSGWTGSMMGTVSTSILSIKAEDKGDAYINTNKNKINLDQMHETIEALRERLLILSPNFEMHDKYPVLKDLYEQYKVVEAMLKEETDDKKL